MALNKETFRTRTLTAIVFVVVMMAGLLVNHWSFFLLFSLIHFGCWWEYLALTEKIHQTRFHPYSKLGWMLIGYGLMLRFCEGGSYYIGKYGLAENLSLPISAAGFALLIIGIFQQKNLRAKAFGMAAIGLLYISLSWGLMIHLYLHPIGQNHALLLPLIVIGCMWVNDTMAYIVGSLIGKTPLSKISPKKTWEGTIGGMILATALMGYLGFLFDRRINDNQLLWKWMLLALVAVIVGTLGDLLESKIKRMAGVKDSGSFMPGHGGFLDRFDSLILAVPFAWLFIEFAMR
jgi:phosphatidate cytidylyltransferase